MKKHVALSVALGISLSGCALGVGSSKFACPGMPNGVVCKSPAEVYALTNTSDGLESDGAKQKDDKNPFTRPAIKTNSGPVPVLEEAQVMRIWIAPWVDEKRDLHWPSYLFTEITPRRWSFGGVEFRSQKPLVPMSADFATSAAAAGKGNASASAAGPNDAVVTPGIPNVPLPSN